MHRIERKHRAQQLHARGREIKRTIERVQQRTISEPLPGPLYWGEGRRFRKNKSIKRSGDDD